MSDVKRLRYYTGTNTSRVREMEAAVRRPSQAHGGEPGRREHACRWQQSGGLNEHPRGVSKMPRSDPGLGLRAVSYLTDEACSEQACASSGLGRIQTRYRALYGEAAAFEAAGDGAELGFPTILS